MKNFYKTLIVCAGLATAAPVTAQTLYFDQYYQTPLLINPSFGALRMDVQATVGYRSTNVGGGTSDVNSAFASVAYPLIKRVRRKETHYGYIGGNIISDRTGPGGALTTTGLTLSGGYRVPITKTITTAFGLGVGMFQKALSAENIRTDAQFDVLNGIYNSARANGEEGTTGFKSSVIYPSISFGASIFHQNKEKEITAYFGISGSNLNSPVTFYSSSAGNKIAPQISAIGGIRAYENYQFIITPNFRYTYLNSLYQQINVGSLFHYKLADKRGGFLGYGTAGVGLFYNVNGVAVTALELNQPNYKLGIAYDIFLNGQTTTPATASQLEVFFTFRKYLGRERLRKNSFRPRGGGGSKRPSKK